MLDATAWFAVMELSPLGRWPRTHASSFQLLKAVAVGEEVELIAKVDQAGFRTAFIRVEAHASVAGESALIATAAITKSFVAA